MQLSETNNVWPLTLEIVPSVESNELRLCGDDFFASLDQTTAAELLPILEHFIKTGELPE